MKVRYIGPGVGTDEDLTIGKVYDAAEDEVWDSGVEIVDDAGDTVFMIIKDRAICPFEEYVEIIEE